MGKIFLSENGSEIPAVSKKQMIEIDRLAMEQFGPNLFQMMENAGRNLALTTMELTAKIDNPKIIVLAGTGGNGGGGICAARHLANRDFNVALAITNEKKLQPIPKEQLEIYFNTNADVINDFSNLKPDIIVDAIIGYSLSNEPIGIAKEFIEWANRTNAIKLSLDIPSGINSTTGEVYGAFFKADKTVTLALPKSGLSRKTCGDILLADIGIPRIVYEKLNLNFTSPFKNEFVIKLLEA